MVSRAGKDLLKNTIRSTDYHNKMMQEEDMWRQWEIEKGLTMMVTDDCIRNRMRMDNYKKRNEASFRSVDTKQLQKQKEAARESRRGNYWSRKLMEAEDNDPDRWGHSGYRELYPEEFRQRPVSASPTNSHLYDSQDRLKSKKKHHSRKKHKGKEKKAKKASHKKKRHKSIDSESSVSKVERKFNTESEKNRSSSSDFSKSSSSKQSEDHHDSDDKMFSSLSAISAKELARRREYLKRKLEEFSKDSSPDEHLNEDSGKSSKSRRFQNHMQKHLRSKKLQSQIVIEKRCSNSMKHKPLS